MWQEKKLSWIIKSSHGRSLQFIDFEVRVSYARVNKNEIALPCLLVMPRRLSKDRLSNQEKSQQVAKTSRYVEVLVQSDAIIEKPNQSEYCIYVSNQTLIFSRSCQNYKFRRW